MKKLRFLFDGHPWYDYLDATIIQGLKNLGHKVYGASGNSNNYAEPHQNQDYDVFLFSVLPSEIEVRSSIPKVILWGGDSGQSEMACMPNLQRAHWDVAFVRDFRGGLPRTFPINFGIEDRYYCVTGRTPKPYKKREIDIVFLGQINNCQGRQQYFDAIKKHFGSFNVLIDKPIYRTPDPYWAQWLNVHCCHDQRYFETLNNAKVILSPMGAGPDCARHWEAFASGGIPLIERMPTQMCEPLVDNTDCLLFSNPNELLAKARFVLEKQDTGMLISELAFQRGRLSHTTRARAQYMIDVMRREGLL